MSDSNGNDNVHKCRCSKCGHTAFLLKRGNHDCDNCDGKNTMKPVK